MFFRIALFWLGLFAAISVSAAVSIYGFDYFEPQWGRGISLQVSTWIAGVAGLIGAVGFLVGLRFFGGAPPKVLALATGVGVGLALFIVARVQESLVSTTSGRQLFAAVVVFTLSLLAALTFRRRRRASV